MAASRQGDWAAGVQYLASSRPACSCPDDRLPSSWRSQWAAPLLLTLRRTGPRPARPAPSARSAGCCLFRQLLSPVWLHEAAGHDCSAPATARQSIWDELAGLRRTPLHCGRPVPSVGTGRPQGLGCAVRETADPVSTHDLAGKRPCTDHISTPTVLDPRLANPAWATRRVPWCLPIYASA